jgi:hypothetical protein
MRARALHLVFAAVVGLPVLDFPVLDFPVMDFPVMDFPVMDLSILGLSGAHAADVQTKDAPDLSTVRAAIKAKN